MLRKIVFAAIATALVGAVALPVGLTSADAAVLTCKQAAKLKFPTDFKQRHAYKKACVAAWKASQKA